MTVIGARCRLAARGLFIAAAAALAACGGDNSDESETGNHDEDSSYASSSTAVEYSPARDRASDDYDSEVSEERAPFDDYAAREAAEEEMADESYGSIGMPYGCMDDCSGHEAGYRYRADNGYVGYNPDGRSFNEGGQAFEEAVDERVEEMRNNYEIDGSAPY